VTPRFLIDQGAATTSAALVARLGGRWRLLAAQAFPATVELDAVLDYVTERAMGALEGLASEVRSWGEWRSFERVVVASTPLRRITVLGATARRAADLAAAAEQAGWRVAARMSPDRDDAVAIGAALAERTIDAVLLGGADPPRSDERDLLADLAAQAGAVVAQRPQLITILSGAAAEQRDRFPFERVVLAPPARPPEASAGGSDLTRILTALGGQLHGPRFRAARSVGTLAELLEQTIEFVDVGVSAGAWFRATPGASMEGFLVSSGALVPDELDDDEAILDEVIAWSPLRLDRPTHRDRLRDLRTHPWWDAAGEGALLRMAAVRAALARLEGMRVRLGGSPPERMPNADLLVIAGGAVAVAPGPAIALAVADTIRRPGLTRIAHDHAALLAPLGTLGDDERRELLSDLAADVLLPLGSMLIVAGGRPGRDVGSLSVSSEWATPEAQPLSGGALRLIELPPGAPATVDVQLRDGRLGQQRARAVVLEASGGLGGLLVDTRGVPMRLPQAGERRREVLAQWQHSLWPGAE
jgi:hypothetical protein